MKKLIQVQPLDPIMIRDGRPFNRTPGIRAHTLTHIPPSVLAGSIRTMLAKAAQHSEGAASPLNRFAKMSVRGPLYVWKGQIYFAVPQDAQVYEHQNDVRVQPVLPQQRQTDEDSGFYGTGKMGLYEDLWLPHVFPSHNPKAESDEYKLSSKQPTHLSASYMYRWLSQPDETFQADYAHQVQQWKKHQQHAEPYADLAEKPAFLPLFQKEERTHIEMDTLTSRVKEQHLFTTQSLVFPEGLSLQAEITLPEQQQDKISLSELHPIGGKRRLAHFSEVKTGNDDVWQCPKDILTSLENKKYIRMVLATPAYFTRGWLPGWLDEQLQSKPSFSSSIRLQLRWACVSRWEPISGWRIPIGQKQGHEKAIRRMVPAGSVYFFEVIEDKHGVIGNPAELAKAKWLESVADPNRRHGAFDAEDGCGLALWGVWNL